MRKLLRLLKLQEESGAALVVVAIAMVALLGFAALAIDGGRLYIAKSKLQNAVDAAVLAGAQGLKNSEEQAIANAEEVANQNGIALTESEITIIDHSIKVKKQINVPLTFAKVIGINDADVAASAKALVGFIQQVHGVFPIAVEDSQIPNGTDLICVKKNGNCGYLALGGTGASDLKTVIENGGTYSVGNIVTTEPGQMTSVNDAINDLIASDQDKPQCQSPDTADKQCKRVIYVVVIDTWDVDSNGKDLSGRSKIKVKGFAAYWLQGFDDKNKTLKGQFIARLIPGELSDTGAGTLYGVKLVE